MPDLFSQLKHALPDRYELERLLGSGGMATVYLARDRQQGRRVAIKLLRPELAGALGLDRFLREIRIASELTHPHILPLLDSGTVTLNGDSIPYYVMPYVEGESLRDRLAREKQLSIEDTLSIARDIAAALAHAHKHGFIHRDIKPENILLAGHEAVVADFGIARAIDRSADLEAVTTSGIAIGTPAYMSPEQASAEAELDGRTDIYSLGCVVYEMLGGDPPFSGSSANAIAARHRVDAVPPLRTIRPSVPLPVEAAILRALEKIPADRFASAEQFAAALSQRQGTTTPIPARPGGNRRRMAVVLAGALVLAIGSGYAVVRDYQRRGGAGLALDTTVYAIIPTQRDTLSDHKVDPAITLQDALAQWSGITLVDPIKIREAMTRRGTMEGGDWRKVAIDVGAGRYIRVDAATIGDSVRVQAVLYDTRGQAQLADRSIRIASGRSSDAYGDLAERLLFRSEDPRNTMDTPAGTTSAPARQAFNTGLDAVGRWDLLAADTAFNTATRYDAQYAPAFLWLALVRMWSGQEIPIWRSPAERAAAGRSKFTIRDQIISDAVLAFARSEISASCKAWERLTSIAPNDFAAWYGLGDCLRHYDAVVRDRASPTGWRFVSSYQQALKSYQRAFALMPSIHRSLSNESFAEVRSLLYTSESNLRSGKAMPPDTTLFAASPSWQGDSLVFLPIPLADIAQGRSPGTATTSDAVLHQRQRFKEIAAAWVAALPRSAEALEALAVSLEMLGDASALDTMRRARDFARTPLERLRVAGSEVWMRVKFSLPDQTSELRLARVLADSLLKEFQGDNPPESALLGSLAALTGRADLAARLSLAPAVQAAWGIPPALSGSAAPLRVYAAMGGPGDSLQLLEGRVIRAIDQDVPGSERQDDRMQWLALPATLAFPEHRLNSITQLDGSGDNLLNLQAAFLRGDSAGVRRGLASLREARTSVRPADMAIDNLFLEAWLLRSLGDVRAAADWLDPTLSSISMAAPQLFAEAYQAGPLVRTMVLRAELAATMGDSASARRWATAVVVLWSDADDFLRPVVRRMKELSR